MIQIDEARLSDFACYEKYSILYNYANFGPKQAQKWVLGILGLANLSDIVHPRVLTC